MDRASIPCFPIGTSPPPSAAGTGIRTASTSFSNPPGIAKRKSGRIRERTGLTGWLARAKPEPVQLTGGQLNSLAPVFSPDGKKLYVIGQQQRGELERYDSKSREWAPYLSGISADFVEFSRDKQWITYVTFPDEILWRSRIDGSDRLQLTRPPMQVVLPSWSPDGTKSRSRVSHRASLGERTLFRPQAARFNPCCRNRIIRRYQLVAGRDKHPPQLRLLSRNQLHGITIVHLATTPERDARYGRPLASAMVARRTIHCSENE